MISVCMATYNGEDFILEQLTSILCQLGESDELVICDDNSQDKTVDIITGLADSRIRLVKNAVNLGYVNNFLKAIRLARGDVLFLADQDDIWIQGRVEKMLNALDASGKNIVVGNFNFIKERGSTIKRISPSLSEKHNRSSVKNLLTMFKGGIPYFGCCMAFKSEFKPSLLRCADEKISHDIMIALLGNKKNEIFHISDEVLTRRIHGNNLTSSNRSFVAKVKTRVDWFLFLLRA